MCPRLAGVKLIGHRLNSEGSPVTLANAAVVKINDIDAIAIAVKIPLRANPMFL